MRDSKQSFAILPWIREVDEALRAAPELRERVREAHPEISFYYLNGERPMAHSKKSGLGFLERYRLIQEHFGPVVEPLRDRGMTTGEVLGPRYFPCKTSGRCL